LRVQRGSANFDLAFELWESAEGLEGRFDYSTDLFDAASIARLGAHYLSLLDRVLEQPDVPVESLALLSEAETGAAAGRLEPHRHAIPERRDLPGCSRPRSHAIPTPSRWTTDAMHQLREPE